eukprot:SAG22_NODE_2077_length_3044_cov_2.301868_2_plen_480_part_00
MKAGGQEGTKKKKTRFFTLGNEMIAYFDAKDMKGATMKKLKGTFPIDAESTVELRGLVDGKAEQLPWPQGYAFEITSSGRTFKLFAETEVAQRKWTRGVMTMIDYLSKRGTTAGAFSEQIGRFAGACVGINQVLGDAVELTISSTNESVATMKGNLGTASDEIMTNLIDNKNRMDVLVSRTREAIKGYDAKVHAMYEESELDSAKRADVTAVMDRDKAIITGAGAAVDAAQANTATIAADLQTLIRDKLTEAIGLVTNAMEQAQRTADEELVGVFNTLESAMSPVAALGGGDAFATGWWEDFKRSVGPLATLFDIVDEDGSGKIEKTELKSALLTSEEFSSVLKLVGLEDSESLFTAIDMDDNLSISFSEFCAYFAGAPFVHMFIADADGSGALSLDEFEAAVNAPDSKLNLMAYGVTAAQVFEEGDTDHNGAMTFGEFSAVFLRLGVSDEEPAEPEPEPTELEPAPEPEPDPEPSDAD